VAWSRKVAVRSLWRGQKEVRAWPRQGHLVSSAPGSASSHLRQHVGPAAAGGPGGGGG
jgi:hypothetical protein